MRSVFYLDAGGKNLLKLLAISAIILFFASCAGVVSEGDITATFYDDTAHNLSEKEVFWDNTTFPGFNIDKNLGTETLAFVLSNVNLDRSVATLGVGDIIYSTKAEPRSFAFKPWGRYDLIGFLGQKYFAAYRDVQVDDPLTQLLYGVSNNKNLMANRRLSKVLMDDSTKRVITSAGPMKLSEGYQLAIKSIYNNNVSLELTKNGQVVDSKIIQPSIENSSMADQTYFYKADLGDAQGIVQIAVHFRDAFHVANSDIAYADGVFQISDEPISIDAGQKFGMLSVTTVDPRAMSLKMDNRDGAITLSKNKTINLMQNIDIRTLDQVFSHNATSPLRYYIYEASTVPGIMAALPEINDRAIALTAATTTSSANAQVRSQDSVKVRGPVADLGANNIIWDYRNFAGFYYDIDQDIGTESIAFTLSDLAPDLTSATLTDQVINGAPRGVVYSTTAKPADFKFKEWGQYNVIGFMAEKHFAGYLSGGYLFDESKNKDLMANGLLSKVLMDDDTERTITSATPLALGEGYQLAIKSIDVKGNKVYLELSKNELVVDSKVIQPSDDNANMSQKTYYYKLSIGENSDIIQIAVHFKNAFSGVDANIATVDGVFQISDIPISIKADTTYDKMSISSVSGNTIRMDNKDNQITLSKNKDAVLMQSIQIKTADQDANVENPLRYCIYKLYAAPGTYEIRGTAADIGTGEASWSPKNFTGFFYDIDNDIGTETITFRLSPDSGASTATLSDQVDANNDRGVVYSTTAQAKAFKFKDWGAYSAIGFIGSPYLVSYLENPTESMINNGSGSTTYSLFAQSRNPNLMANEQLSQVLMDDNKEITLTTSAPLKLDEGYQLALKSVNIDGKAYVDVELAKNNQVLDDKVLQLSISNATTSDQTYFYNTTIGNTAEIVQIAVHFKNAFHGSDENIATVDGEFQISDTPVSLKVDTQYDKMSIRTVDPIAGTITMDNKDNAITLRKNKDTVLMQNIHIKTADQDASLVAVLGPLRYNIYPVQSAAEPSIENVIVPNVTGMNRTFAHSLLEQMGLGVLEQNGSSSEVDQVVGQDPAPGNIVNAEHQVVLFLSVVPLPYPSPTSPSSGNATTPSPTPPKVPWEAVAIAAASITAISAGLYHAMRRQNVDKKTEKSKTKKESGEAVNSQPKLEFNLAKDATGTQKIVSDVPLHPDLDVRLRSIRDMGRQTIKARDGVISDGSELLE